MPVIEFSDDEIPSAKRLLENQSTIEALQREGRHLTAWERTFLNDIEGTLAEHGFLTSGQQLELDRLAETKLF